MGKTRITHSFRKPPESDGDFPKVERQKKSEGLSFFCTRKVGRSFCLSTDCQPLSSTPSSGKNKIPMFRVTMSHQNYYTREFAFRRLM